MTVTKEQIERLKQLSQDFGRRISPSLNQIIKAHNDLHALISAWEAIQPRPIEDSTPNEQHLLYCPETFALSNKERWEVDFYEKGRRVGQHSNISRHPWATHFIPLSALPKPGVNCDTCQDTGETMGMDCVGNAPFERQQYCPDCGSGEWIDT